MALFLLTYSLVAAGFYAVMLGTAREVANPVILVLEVNNEFRKAA